MRKLPFFLLLVVLSVWSNAVRAQCPNGRYYDKIFSQSVTTVTYGHAMKFDSTYVDLLMDIYQPTGDNFAHRPLIVLAFPGSFTAGIRQSPDIVTLCDNFSRRGYVCASIDYRLGFEGGSDCDTNQFKALMRGVQDMKAAVRYFYKDAQTANTFRIDTNQIFIGGSSAGAFIALNYAYGKLDTLSRQEPPWARPALDSLGGPEGNSGNPGYSTKVKGVIDLCGGIADTVWMMPGDPILVGVHGTADATVSCYYDSVYASTHPESLLFGGGDIKNRLEHINLNHYFYLFQGADHVPYILPYPFVPPASYYMDSTIWIVRDFLATNTLCDSATISGTEVLRYDLPVSVLPNPSHAVVQITSRFDETLEAKLYALDGRLVWQSEVPAFAQVNFSKTETGTGIFLLRLQQPRHPDIHTSQRIVLY